MLEDGTLYEADYDYKKDAVAKLKDLSPIEGGINKTVVAEPLKAALGNVGKMLENIREKTGATSHRIYLTGKGNFREELVDDYKGNRPRTKPVHYEAIKNYLIEVWGAEVIEGQEADDAMGIDQMRNIDYNRPSIICTKDKDLMGIPGLHYNWGWDTISDVSSHEALIFFYYQLLAGDSVDNIAGLYRSTGKKLTKGVIFGLLDCEMEEDMWEYVRGVYGRDYPVSKLITTGRLLYMRRMDNEDWMPPPEEESGSEVYGEVQSTSADSKQKEIQEEKEKRK